MFLGKCLGERLWTTHAVLSCSSESGMIYAEVCLMAFQVQGWVCVDGRDRACVIDIDKY